MAVTVSPERDTVATPVQRALREALYAGAISLGLFVLFIGLKTDQNICNELILMTRWGLLLTVVVLTMAVGRFLYVAYGQPFMANQKIANVATGLLPASVASRFFLLPCFIAAVVAGGAAVCVRQLSCRSWWAMVLPAICSSCARWPSSMCWPA